MGQNWNIIKPENEIDKMLYEFTHLYRTGYIEIGEEKTVMPLGYKEVAEEIENLEVKDSDIIVASYPKTGNYNTRYCMVLCTFYPLRYHLVPRDGLDDLQFGLRAWKNRTENSFSLPRVSSTTEKQSQASREISFQIGWYSRV